MTEERLSLASERLREIPQETAAPDYLPEAGWPDATVTECLPETVQQTLPLT